MKNSCRGSEAWEITAADAGLHQPHAAARSAGKVVGAADGKSSAAAHADHLQHQPRISAGDEAVLVPRRREAAQDVDHRGRLRKAGAHGAPVHRGQPFGERRLRVAHRPAGQLAGAGIRPGLAGEVQQQDQRRGAAALADESQRRSHRSDQPHPRREQVDHRPAQAARPGAVRRRRRISRRRSRK